MASDTDDMFTDLDTDYVTTYVNEYVLNPDPWLNSLVKDQALLRAKRVILRLVAIDNDDIRHAICEEAIALADGRDPEEDYRSLDTIQRRFGPVSETTRPGASKSRAFVAAGLVSLEAWRLIRPYLDLHTLEVGRV